ncbi:MAG: fluoride efflux transporter CrcB [Pseudomonadota bacterium]
MHHIAFIAAGGAAGALARYWVGVTVREAWAFSWPFATFLINVSGSLCMGVMFVLIERSQIHPDWRSIIMVGFLGAFTTFSTFSLETVELWEKVSASIAIAYALGTTTCCVLAAALGIFLTRQLLT